MADEAPPPMADEAPPDGSSALRQSLQRCNGGTGCPCISETEPPPRSPPAGDLSANRTSRSRTAQEGDKDTGDSADHSASQHISESQDNSDTSVPDAVYDYDWSGMNVVKLSKCAHGRCAVLKKFPSTAKR